MVVVRWWCNGCHLAIPTKTLNTTAAKAMNSPATAFNATPPAAQAPFDADSTVSIPPTGPTVGRGVPSDDVEATGASAAAAAAVIPPPSAAVPGAAIPLSPSAEVADVEMPPHAAVSTAGDRAGDRASPVSVIDTITASIMNSISYQAQAHAGVDLKQMARLDHEDVRTATELGLLREGVVTMSHLFASHEISVLYDKSRNLATSTFETQRIIQRKWRDFANARGFSLCVLGNSTNKVTGEGNAKYGCKAVNGSDASSRCPFFANVYGKNGEWKVTKVQLAHNHLKFVGYQQTPFVERDTTTDAVPVPRALRSRDVDHDALLLLLEEQFLPTYKSAEAQISNKAVRNFLQTKGHAVSLQAAGTLKRQLLEKQAMDVVDSYQRLEDYLSSVASENPGSYWAFEKEGDRFLRACFFPAACLRAPTAKDYDHHIIVFGFALVRVENFDNWSWFLRQLATAAAGVGDDIDTLFISDRQKGLLAAVETVFPGSGHRFCLRHIIGNIAKRGQRLTPAEEAFVFEMARADCESDWQLAFNQLQKIRPAACEYLTTIPLEHWVKYAIHEGANKPTYDEVTSNLSESANNWIGNTCRSSSPVLAFQIYFLKIAEQFHERRQSAPADSSSVVSQVSQQLDQHVGSQVAQQIALLPRWKLKLENLLKASGNCTILPCLDNMYMVMYNDGKPRRNGYIHPWRAVNLAERTCSCQNWHDLQFPCVHSVQAAVRHGAPIYDLFKYENFTISAFKATYNYPFVPTPPKPSLRVDRGLVVPAVMLEDIRIGKRGRCPGPQPKHKRKTARVGSAASPFVVMQ